MKQSKFAIGTKIFRWTVTSDRYNIGNGLYVNCRCECGTEKPVQLPSLSGQNPRSKSCGCLAKELALGVIKKPLTVGEKFTRLTVISEGEIVNDKAKYLVRCDCGVEKVVDRVALISGATKSCGCLNAELSSQRKTNLSHGMSGTPVYNTWLSMRRRCYGESDSSYENYGGRGIQVCDRWNPDKGGSFENFYRDMGTIPYEGASIERLDVNGDYSLQNCVWADKTTQCFNRRKFKNKTSQYIGVHYDEVKNKPWRATLKKEGIIVFLGSYLTEIEAAKGYDEACLEHYGVRKNFPDEN